MGILKSLFTLGKSFISQAEESIEETQGVRMLEQHIRDAKAELDKAGKSRVDLLARVKLSHDKLKDLRERKASLEARALEALSKNVNPSLINEVAEEIARLENLITAEEQVLSNLEVSRDGVEKAVTATVPVSYTHLYHWQAPDVSEWSTRTFKGYVRDDGRVGTASYWLVFPLVFCENRNVSKLTNALNDALGYTNNSLKKFALNLTSGSDELIETARMFPHIEGVRCITVTSG